MGMGGRFAYKTDKKFEETPGPGMYSDTCPNTIEKSLERSKRNGSLSPRLGFGASRE